MASLKIGRASKWQLRVRPVRRGSRRHPRQIRLRRTRVGRSLSADTVTVPERPLPGDYKTGTENIPVCPVGGGDLTVALGWWHPLIATPISVFEVAGESVQDTGSVTPSGPPLLAKGAMPIPQWHWRLPGRGLLSVAALRLLNWGQGTNEQPSPMANLRGNPLVDEDRHLSWLLATFNHMFHDLRKPAKQAHQGSEDALQKQCAEWLKKALLRHDLPQEIFWHVPSEGIRKPQYRMKLKAMGFRAGIPDICLMLPSEEHHGVFCELKKAGESPSPDQKKLLSALTSQGYLAVVINDFETFKSVFGYYIENRTNL